MGSQNKDFGISEILPVIIVHDFMIFIEYIQSHDVMLTKKNRYMNRKDLYMMNSLVTFTAKEVSTNSDQPAYPLLHLFYHLILAARLFQIQSIKGGKLVLRPTERLELFMKLNHTEKYVSLLETFWVDTDWQKLQGGSFGQVPHPEVFELVFAILLSLPPDREVNLRDENMKSLNQLLWRFEYFLYYLSYFGFWKVEKDEEESNVNGWKRHFEVKTIIPTLFLHKFGEVLIHTRDLTHWNLALRREEGDWRGSPGAPLPVEDNVVQLKQGELFYQAFTPLFSDGELEKTLPRIQHVFVAGTYLFKVALNSNCWRTIELNGSHTLLKLHHTIQKAFHFHDDHLYAFFMDGEKWSKNVFNSTMDEQGPYVDEVKIGELGLTVGNKFLYVFDFGDEWEFWVELLEVKPGETSKESKIVESKGKAPEQYAW